MYVLMFVLHIYCLPCVHLLLVCYNTLRICILFSMYIHVYTCLYVQCTCIHVPFYIQTCTIHGKYVYSTLALGKEREIVKEETALRKEKEAVCCYVHVHVHV